MEENFSIGFSFFAGLVSFLSPCVLPLVPGFLAYLAGFSVNDAATKRWRIFLNSIFFVLGFSVVFALLGVLLRTVLQNVSYDVQIWLSRFGGVLIMFFGIYLLGLINLPWLERDHKLQIKTRFNSKYLTSFLIGAAFAAGWTPCVGVVLGGILGLAVAQPGSAFVLLLSYSLGLGLPFLVAGLFVDQAQTIIHKYVKVVKYLRFLFGLILIALGILVFTQQLELVANFSFVNQWLLN